VQDVFLGLVHVTSATAENLMTAIQGFLLAKDVPLEKAVLVGFDGCNTMSGENKGTNNILLNYYSNRPGSLNIFASH
jgi:hypothetical protein